MTPKPSSECCNDCKGLDGSQGAVGCSNPGCPCHIHHAPHNDGGSNPFDLPQESKNGGAGGYKPSSIGGLGGIGNPGSSSPNHWTPTLGESQEIPPGDCPYGCGDNKHICIFAKTPESQEPERFSVGGALAEAASDLDWESPKTPEAVDVEGIVEREFHFDDDDTAHCSRAFLVELVTKLTALTTAKATDVGWEEKFEAALPLIVKDYNDFIFNAGEIGELDIEEIVSERLKPLFHELTALTATPTVEGEEWKVPTDLQKDTWSVIEYHDFNVVVPSVDSTPHELGTLTCLCNPRVTLQEGQQMVLHNSWRDSTAIDNSLKGIFK